MKNKTKEEWIKEVYERALPFKHFYHVVNMVNEEITVTIVDGQPPHTKRIVVLDLYYDPMFVLKDFDTREQASAWVKKMGWFATKSSNSSYGKTKEDEFKCPYCGSVDIVDIKSSAIVEDWHKYQCFVCKESFFLKVVMSVMCKKLSSKP